MEETHVIHRMSDEEIVVMCQSIRKHLSENQTDKSLNDLLRKLIEEQQRRGI